MHTVRRSLAALSLLAAVVGCSPKQVKPDNPQGLKQEVLIYVNNDAIPPRDFTISVLSENGTRATLGSVSPSASTVLKYRPVGSQSRFTLVAHTSGGRDIRSQPFTFIDATEVSWSISQNVVSVR